jgi:hypothetical protein
MADDNGGLGGKERSGQNRRSSESGGQNPNPSPNISGTLHERGNY